MILFATLLGILVIQGWTWGVRSPNNHEAQQCCPPLPQGLFKCRGIPHPSGLPRSFRLEGERSHLSLPKLLTKRLLANIHINFIKTHLVVSLNVLRTKHIKQKATVGVGTNSLYRTVHWQAHNSRGRVSSVFFY